MSVNPFRGTGSVFIGGHTRPIKFSTNQAAVYCALQKQPFSLDDYFTGIAPFRLNVRDLLYSCLADGAQSQRRPANFDVYTVGDWMDETSQEDFSKIFLEMLSAMMQSLPKEDPPKPADPEDKKKEVPPRDWMESG